MDEFLYSKEYTNISHAIDGSLVGKLSNTSVISLQMKVFLPGAFESPASIIETNTVVMSPDSPKYPKCIYNMDFLLDVSIHGEGFETFEGLYVRASETILNINHYRYESFEFVYGIKEIRGGGMHHHKYNGKKIIEDLGKNDPDFGKQDTYLRDHINSKHVIAMSKEKHIRPKVKLYPKTRWNFFKISNPSKYTEFKQYNNGNKTLSPQQVYEIGSYFIAFEWKVGKGYIFNGTKYELYQQALPV